MQLQFADLTFDRDSRQLWVRGQEIQLSPKAFDLLALLVERRPNAVSKADITAHLWPGTFVSPSSLPSLVSEIRQAIADHRRRPRLIRTLNRVGYAFDSEQLQSSVQAARLLRPAGLAHQRHLGSGSLYPEKTSSGAKAKGSGS
jgi:DNA-binding winged helix-turn-helix (wHTH) protein